MHVLVGCVLLSGEIILYYHVCIHALYLIFTWLRSSNDYSALSNIVLFPYLNIKLAHGSFLCEHITL